jgi:hypothetical protein
LRQPIGRWSVIGFLITFRRVSLVWFARILSFTSNCAISELNRLKVLGILVAGFISIKTFFSVCKYTLTRPALFKGESRIVSKVCFLLLYLVGYVRSVNRVVTFQFILNKVSVVVAIQQNCFFSQFHCVQISIFTINFTLFQGLLLFFFCLLHLAHPVNFIYSRFLFKVQFLHYSLRLTLQLFFTLFF